MKVKPLSPRALLASDLKTRDQARDNLRLAEDALSIAVTRWQRCRSRVRWFDRRIAELEAKR